MSPRTIDAVSPINLLKRHARTRKLEKELAKQVQKSGIKKQALILVGDFLNAKAKGQRSRLYDGNFKHEYR